MWLDTNDIWPFGHWIRPRLLRQGFRHGSITGPHRPSRHGCLFCSSGIRIRGIATVRRQSLRAQSLVRPRTGAAAKGLRRDVDYDDELVFLSCMLHDLGVTEHANGDQRFEVDGADAAAQFLRDHGMSETGSRRSGRRSRCTRAPAWHTGSVPNRPLLSWASRQTSWASTSTYFQRVMPNKRTNPGCGTTSATHWPRPSRGIVKTCGSAVTRLADHLLIRRVVRRVSPS
jgi:hypothetical protein